MSVGEWKQDEENFDPNKRLTDAKPLYKRAGFRKFGRWVQFRACAERGISMYVRQYNNAMHNSHDDNWLDNDEDWGKRFLNLWWMGYRDRLTKGTMTWDQFNAEMKAIVKRPRRPKGYTPAEYEYEQIFAEMMLSDFGQDRMRTLCEI